MFRYTTFLRYAQFFLHVVKDRKCRTSSGVCSEVRTSQTAPLSPVGARLRTVSESHLCMMMAEGDESLELFPLSKNTVCRMEMFPVM